MQNRSKSVRAAATPVGKKNKTNRVKLLGSAYSRTDQSNQIPKGSRLASCDYARTPPAAAGRRDASPRGHIIRREVIRLEHPIGTAEHLDAGKPIPIAATPQGFCRPLP